LGTEDKKKSLIIIYTGEGKGKTSAAVGQAVRALGAGLRVGFGQFLKKDNQAGEQLVLKDLLAKDMFMAAGKGFYRYGRDHERHRQGALDLLRWAGRKIQDQVDLLILDEAIYALGKELISREEVSALLDLAQTRGIHIVMTGRDAPAWLKERADLISEILVVKHPFEQNIPPQKGIEF